jgi:uncharacterized protein YkwD
VNGNANNDNGNNNNQSQVERVCERWNTDRADMAEGGWTGDTATCDPGDISAEGRANAIKILNLYRWLADLPETTLDQERSRKNQECALMMAANGRLSHSPDSSWQCYTSDGAQGAGASCIAMSPAVEAIDLYMIDPGNETTLGHRRWLLANDLGAVGIGSTHAYSCHWVVGTGGQGDARWTAWPPPGPFPEEGMGGLWFTLDDTGWSVQSDTINLSGAQVNVTGDGTPLAVTIRHLEGGYGSTYAIAFFPDGWQSRAGVTYHVEVTGTAVPIEYDVTIVDCLRLR